MDKLKFALFSIVTLSLLGLLVYWAIDTIQSGSEYVSADKIKKLEKDNSALGSEVKNLKDQLGVLQQEVKDEIQSPAGDVTQPTVAENTPTPASGFKYQELINELQKMTDDNVFVKLKSRGTRVGTLQKFFNIYNKTSNKIDNDFGADMKNEVIAFQKDQGLSADGEAGKATFNKMIDWLKQQV